MLIRSAQGGNLDVPFTPPLDEFKYSIDLRVARLGAGIYGRSVSAGWMCLASNASGVRN
jgi:hypothetical protein